MLRALVSYAFLVLTMAYAAPAYAQGPVVTLAWDPVPNGAGYVVYYGKTSHRYSSSVDVGNRTSFVFTPPTSGRYFFAVLTYDSAGYQGELSAEVTTVVEAAPETALTVDIAPPSISATATALDVAFDPFSRRYLVTYSSAGETWIQMLDLWGTAIGSPMSITPGGSGVQPRIASGGGRFVVVYTDTTAGTRVARFVQTGVSTPTVGSAVSLGVATTATGDINNPGAGVTYDYTDNAFVAAWENSGNVFARGIKSTGTTGPALNLTSDSAVTGCQYARPELSWDDALHRAVLIGTREGASCLNGGVWTRIIGYDGAAVSLVSDVSMVSAADDAQSFHRIAFNNLQNRFIMLWSEPHTDATTITYRLADATGGLSAPRVIPTGGDLTPELEDDGYIENSVALDSSGTFSIVSRATPPAGSTAGQLYLQRIDANGNDAGSLQALPASGTRTRVALTPNTVTGQLLAVYLDSNGHLRALTIGARPPMTVTAKASLSTISLSQSVTVTGTANGGIAPYEFTFWRYDVTRAKWFAAQPYGTSATFSWTPTSADVGTHVFQVWARSAGSTASYEGWQSVSVVVSPPQPLSVQLTWSPRFPVAAGTPVTWTATPAGGSGTVEYQFWVYNTTAGTWTVGRPYSTAPTWMWTPAAGTYVIQVWARTVGSTDSYETWAGTDVVKVNPPAPLAVQSLTATASTATPGTVVTWTARASGGTGPLEYQFWRYNQDMAAWTMAQAYSPSATYSWTPTAADGGAYTVQVWVRSAGSTASYDAWLSSNTLTVTNNVVVTSIGFSTTVRKVGTPITWTAVATKTAGTLEYQFWIYTAASGTWQIARPYNTSPSFTWTPPAGGAYTLQVWARTVGNPRSYEGWLGFGPFIVTP